MTESSPWATCQSPGAGFSPGELSDCGVALKSDRLKSFPVGSEGDPALSQKLAIRRAPGPFMANGVDSPQSFRSGTQISLD